MNIKISKENTLVRPAGVIITISGQKVFIPKSFILNRETFSIDDRLDLEDWFYDIYIVPLENSEKLNSKNNVGEFPEASGEMPIFENP